MVIVAEVVKAIIVGWLINWTRNPKFKIPRSKITVPLRNVAVKKIVSFGQF
jgi:hypothetical protein